jgi:hypothetical protein
MSSIINGGGAGGGAVTSVFGRVGVVVAAANDYTFGQLAAGTNSTAAFLIGTGGSLATSGSGTITATSAPFTGITGTATKAQLPATTVYTDQINTYGAFLQDFTSATFTPPAGWFQTANSANAN